MTHIRLPAPVLKVISPVVRLWWKIRIPKTWGVMVLLTHPVNPGKFLVVRHSYADTKRWALPGGGYKPNRETPEQAAAREIYEELRITVAPPSLTPLRTMTTTLEAKRDTLTILVAEAPMTKAVLSPELTEARWVRSLKDLEPDPVSKWLTEALAARDELE